jgi:hypothetical protein
MTHTNQLTCIDIRIRGSRQPSTSLAGSNTGEGGGHVRANGRLPRAHSRHLEQHNVQAEESSWGRDCPAILVTPCRYR